MSKSLGNYIGISDPPEEIYGKVMSISDEIMADYYHLATRLSSEEVKRIIDGYQGGKIHPRDAKMRLAREIVSLYHGAAAAARAEEGFKQVFQRGKMPSEMEVFEISAAASPDLVSLLVRTALTSSKSEARRLIRQGGIRVNGEQVKDMDLHWQDPAELVLQVGKRKFARVIITGKGG